LLLGGHRSNESRSTVVKGVASRAKCGRWDEKMRRVPEMTRSVVNLPAIPWDGRKVSVEGMNHPVETSLRDSGKSVRAAHGAAHGWVGVEDRRILPVMNANPCDARRWDAPMLCQPRCGASLVNVSVSQRNVKRELRRAPNLLSTTLPMVSAVPCIPGVYHHKVGGFLADQVDIGDSGRKERNSRAISCACGFMRHPAFCLVDAK